MSISFYCEVIKYIKLYSISPNTSSTYIIIITNPDQDTEIIKILKISAKIHTLSMHLMMQAEYQLVVCTEYKQYYPASNIFVYKSRC